MANDRFLSLLSRFPPEHLRFRVGAFAVVVAIFSSLSTFLILMGKTPITPEYSMLLALLFCNLLPTLLLAFLIFSEIARLWRAWMAGDAGAWTQGRLVSLFAFSAATPAIIVALVAGLTLRMSLDYWFADRVQAMIQSSTSVAYVYMREHTDMIRRDILVMSTFLDWIRPLFDRDKVQFSNIVDERMRDRALAGVYIIDNQYSIIAKYTRKVDDNFLIPPVLALQRAKEGGVAILGPGLNDQSDELGALVKLKNYGDSYLYIVRRLDPKVVEHVRETATQAIEYQSMVDSRRGMQVAFALVYANIVLVLLLVSIGSALWFSNRLVAPIKGLIRAARLVSEGRLDVQVQVRQDEGELAQLSATFNGMVNRLETQHDALLQANAALDDRNRFIEAVLAGVTSGVIGIDESGRVELVNRSAELFLDMDSGQLSGLFLGKEVPELQHIMRIALGHDPSLRQEQVLLSRGAGERTVTVRVTPQGMRSGYVVTLDDITESIAAQRASIWRDVARRIAHEMKNPLTPIQLSAERLRRRYAQMVLGDRQVFDQCVDTIIRQVGDIGRMVDEFSAFARMPRAVMGEVDIVSVTREAVFLFSVSHPEIRIDVCSTEAQVLCYCDRHLISQAVTNLMKNAIESVLAFEYGEGESPQIEVDVESEERSVTLSITDNGWGLPVENRQKLLEPYVTCREKGTGLGLAIVQRIMEEHGGRITLSDASHDFGGGHGARVTLILPRQVCAGGRVSDS